jgi:hypothetical protein
MSIKLKKLKDADEWIDNLGEFSNVQSVYKILENMNENRSYSQKDIKDNVGTGTIITRDILDELVDLNLLEEKAGMYYISDFDKVKEINRLVES